MLQQVHPLVHPKFGAALQEVFGRNAGAVVGSLANVTDIQLPLQAGDVKMHAEGQGEGNE
ncbi:MAG: hypothetical protein OQK79_02435 [Rhodanobacter sp.]|nr:hypothetical protein [Rhodanobacter sp.]